MHTEPSASVRRQTETKMFSVGGGRSRSTAAVSVRSAACSTLVVRRQRWPVADSSTSARYDKVDVRDILK